MVGVEREFAKGEEAEVLHQGRRTATTGQKIRDVLAATRGCLTLGVSISRAPVLTQRHTRLLGALGSLKSREHGRERSITWRDFGPHNNTKPTFLSGLSEPKVGFLVFRLKRRRRTSLFL